MKIVLHTNLDLEPHNRAAMTDWSETFSEMETIPRQGDRIKLDNVSVQVSLVQWTKPGKWDDPVVKVELCLTPWDTLPRFHERQKRGK
jgi:hypothetical protein